MISSFLRVQPLLQRSHVRSHELLYFALLSRAESQDLPVRPHVVRYPVMVRVISQVFELDGLADPGPASGQRKCYFPLNAGMGTIPKQLFQPLLVELIRAVERV